MSRRAQVVTDARGSTILPDDGVSDGLTGRAFPQHGGLPLIGNTDRRQVGRGNSRRRQRLDQHEPLAGPDFSGIVLDPARLRIELREFLLRGAADRPSTIENDGARTRSALIQGEHE